MRGITAMMALTILMTGPLWARKEKAAQQSPPDSGGIQNAITHIAPPSDHQRTRSARSTGGRLTPMDHLILEIYDNQFEGQGQSRGVMVGQGYDNYRLPVASWPAVQRDPRVTRRYHRLSPSPVGNQVRIRTTFHPGSTRQIEIRDGFGRPIHWNMEAYSQTPYGFHARD